MVTNKFKYILTIAFCFIVSLCLEAKSMDSESDNQEEISYKAKNIKNEIENYSSDWFSLAASPIKSSINFTNNLMSFVAKNPTYSVILGMTLFVQTANAIVPCYCFCLDTWGNEPRLIGLTPGLRACQQFCTDENWGKARCERF